MINSNFKFSPILSGGYIFLLMLLVLTGCLDDHLICEVSDDKTAVITLDIHTPGLPVAMNTRSMTLDQEKAIQHLQVLIFEETSTGEVFRNIGEVTQSSTSQITIKLPRSSGRYRFVVLANSQTQSIAEDTPKEDALNKYTFSCIGAWPTTGNNSFIPMWGENGTLISIDNDKSIIVTLHRALARVDVGLRFKPQTQDNQTEEVEGLDNFKIKSIRVYRTKNKAYTATSSSKMTGNEVTTPHIPDDAKYNPGNYGSLDQADNDPLVYQLSNAADKYIREIYIPESIELSEISSMDDVPCLVIGGYYGTDTIETFYRADFATYRAEGDISRVDKYIGILRNHRYVFDIKTVKSPGFKNPEHALNSITSEMSLTVEAWNDVSLNIYTQGNYYFGIEKREVWLDASAFNSEGDQTYIFAAIPFRTNIDFIATNPDDDPFNKTYRNVTMSWGQTNEEESDFFLATLITDNALEGNEELFIPKNTLLIQAKEFNIGESGIPATERTDVLNVQVDNLLFTVIVHQKAANIEYDLLCNSTVVHGKYRENIPLNYTHFLEVKIIPILSGDVDIISFEKSHVEIVSETRKGIHFEYKGTIEEGLANGLVKPNNSDGSYIIKLQGYGTPMKDYNDKLNPDTEDGILTRIDNLKINTNSINGSFCNNTTVVFGYKTKRILSIGANASYRYGYMLEPNTGSRAFVDASINFGVDPNSTVTMEQLPNDYLHSGNYQNKSDVSARGNAFHIEYMTLGRGMSGESINVSYLRTMLSEFKPDIILTGQAINFSQDAITEISEFVNKGGVFLMFNEYYPSAESINKMVGSIVNAPLTGQNESMPQNQFGFTLPAGNQYVDDKILNGSFGDLRGKTWGADGYFMHGFDGIPANVVTTYNVRKGDGKPCFFRHNNKPFIFIGDGGFISNAQRYIGPTYQGVADYFPFAINSAYQPIDRTNFTTSNFTVCNSRLFGNILTWAVDYAEFYGINTKNN